MTEELSREKIDEVMEAVEPVPDIPIRRWKIGETSVDIGVDGLMLSGGHATIGGVEVSGVLQKVEISMDINDVTRVVLHTIGMPIELKALAEVIIEEKVVDAATEPIDHPRLGSIRDRRERDIAAGHMPNDTH